jgi:hypothetical protein
MLKAVPIDLDFAAPAFAQAQRGKSAFETVSVRRGVKAGPWPASLRLPAEMLPIVAPGLREM